MWCFQICTQLHHEKLVAMISRLNISTCSKNYHMGEICIVYMTIWIYEIDKYIFQHIKHGSSKPHWSWCGQDYLYGLETLKEAGGVMIDHVTFLFWFYECRFGNTFSQSKQWEDWTHGYPAIVCFVELHLLSPVSVVLHSQMQNCTQKVLSVERVKAWTWSSLIISYYLLYY